MTVKRMDHVGIIVSDLAAAVAFFVDLGLTVQGEGSAEGAWVGNIIGLEGVRTEFAMMETADGHSRLEVIRFRSPESPDSDRGAPANVPGLRHLAFEVDGIEGTMAALEAHGAEFVGKIERGGGYRLAYVRGPEGIIVELAEKIG